MEDVQCANPVLAEVETKTYTAFSQATKLYHTTPQNSWWEALSLIGIIYRDSRLQLEKKHEYKKRVLISQPIVVDKQDVSDMFLERDAKQVFLCVNKQSNGTEFIGSILIVPYSYLSNVEKKHFKVEGRYDELDQIKSDYITVLNDFQKKIEKNIERK